MTIQSTLIEINGHMVRFYGPTTEMRAMAGDHLWVDVMGLARALVPEPEAMEWRKHAASLSREFAHVIRDGNAIVLICHFLTAEAMCLYHEDGGFAIREFSKATDHLLDAEEDDNV